MFIRQSRQHNIAGKKTDRERDKQTNSQTDRQTFRQANMRAVEMSSSEIHKPEQQPN